ncbi:hypothetical protein E1285_43200 [Actinomadura sp. 7K507]|nr:hypothetical protein E1285_43200 [Actinomadura sp. 7K507]
MTPQTRGRVFEQWLHQLLSQEDLAPRTSFRPDGEEVDGSFMFRGWPYLLEAKWWKKGVPASTLYQFKGKVDGKLVGTIGIFISMSGYSDEAVDALRAGKNLNVILLDGSDIHAATTYGFSAVLGYKLREAVERGEIFVPYPTWIASTDNLMLVVVESFHDEAFINGIVKNLQLKGTPTRHLQILVARGIMGLANVAVAAVEESTSPALIFADYDDVPTEQLSGLQYFSGRFRAILVDQWSKKWMGLSSSAEAKTLPAEEILRRTVDIDTDDLAAQDPKFSQLITLLGT